MKDVFSPSCKQLDSIIGNDGVHRYESCEFFSSNLRLRGLFHVCRFYVAVAILHTVLSRRKASLSICPVEESSVLFYFLLQCSWVSCHFINE